VEKIMRLPPFRAAALAAAAFVTLTSSHLLAAPFGPSSIVVLTVGDGTTLSGANATVSLREYGLTLGPTPSASLAQTIAVPSTATTSGNRALTLQGSASAEGGLNLSTDKRYLVFGGYNSTTGAASGSGGSTADRVIGLVDMNGNVDTTNAYSNVNLTGSGNAPRSVATTDGTQFWVVTSAATVRYGTAGQTTAFTSLASTTGRRGDIYNGQLYITAQTTAAAPNGPLEGVGIVGTGTPTTTGQTVSPLPGFAGSNPAPSPNPSPYDFFFADPNTLYVADDGSTTNALGGLQKWTYDSTQSKWVRQYIVNTAALRGLTGTVDPSGNVYLFATSAYATAGANVLYGYVDTLTGTTAPTAVTLDTAPANVQFRGIEFVPEPAGLSLLLTGAAALAARRRRTA
jgi:hypothetical protein